MVSAQHVRLMAERRRNSSDLGPTVNMLKRLELSHNSSGVTLLGATSQPASGQQTPTGSIHEEQDNDVTATPTTTRAFSGSALRVTSTLV